jgi:putative restriction endonuclease
MRFVVGRRLKQDFDNGRSYYELHGRTMTLPSEAVLRPEIETLTWHRENVFLG